MLYDVRVLIHVRLAADIGIYLYSPQMYFRLIIHRFVDGHILSFYLYHHFMVCFRENEQFTIHFDDLFCHNLIKAIKSQTAIADEHTTNSIDLELEPSTPDDGVEPVSVVSHLAEQEHSFSDDSAEFTLSDTRETKVAPSLERPVQTYVDERAVSDNDQLENTRMLEDDEQASGSAPTAKDNIPDVAFSEDS